MIEAPATELYIPKHLKKWKLPSYYFGEHWDGWYVFMTTHRDVDLLDESNWECIKRDIGENPSAAQKEKGLLIVEESHWAVGWVQWMGIHETDYELLMRADDIKAALDDYPVYDDEDYSGRQWESQMCMIEQEFSFFCNRFYGDEEPTEAETDFIVYRLCQDQPDDSTCPDDAEMQEMYDEVHGHLLTCPNQDFGGHYLDGERCPCGRVHVWHWITSIVRRWQTL
jgi:hypothetical protein